MIVCSGFDELAGVLHLWVGLSGQERPPVFSHVVLQLHVNEHPVQHLSHLSWLHDYTDSHITNNVYIRTLYSATPAGRRVWERMYTRHGDSQSYPNLYIS